MRSPFTKAPAPRSAVYSRPSAGMPMTPTTNAPPRITPMETPKRGMPRM
jgi:hypothetical protein